MIEGVLLGTAVGDALGLPMEGLSAGVIEKRFRHLDRYQLFLGRGWVSDDTEQSALVAQSLVVGRGELEPTVRAFRRSMVGWFLRLPWGIGWATNSSGKYLLVPFACKLRKCCINLKPLAIITYDVGSHHLRPRYAQKQHARILAR